MLLTLKKRQDEVVYEVPIVLKQKPDKNTVSKIQKILDKTFFEGDYYDRVRFYIELKKAEFMDVVPMNVSKEL